MVFVDNPLYSNEDHASYIKRNNYTVSGHTPH